VEEFNSTQFNFIHELVYYFVLPFQLLIYDRNIETLQEQPYIFLEYHSEDKVHGLIDSLNKRAMMALKALTCI
jgi:hypothetical protein